MEIVGFLLALLGILGVGVYCITRRKGGAARVPAAAATDESAYRVSYIPPESQWSGITTGSLPIKILTYKQYECLEDARYGFRIVAVAPTERKLPQPHKTRAHGLKTVASLVKHGFLDEDGEGGHVITDHGLNALEVCSVRY